MARPVPAQSHRLLLQPPRLLPLLHCLLSRQFRLLLPLPLLLSRCFGLRFLLQFFDCVRCDVSNLSARPCYKSSNWKIFFPCLHHACPSEPWPASSRERASEEIIFFKGIEARKGPSWHPWHPWSSGRHESKRISHYLLYLFKRIMEACCWEVSGVLPLERRLVLYKMKGWLWLASVNWLSLLLMLILPNES